MSALICLLLSKKINKKQRPDLILMEPNEKATKRRVWANGKGYRYQITQVWNEVVLHFTAIQG